MTTMNKSWGGSLDAAYEARFKKDPSWRDRIRKQRTYHSAGDWTEEINAFRAKQSLEEREAKEQLNKTIKPWAN